MLKMNGKKFRYEEIMDYIRSAIDKGTIYYGRKLPSLRAMSRQFNCAVSVVIQAYSGLEMMGLVRAEEKKGFFAVSAPETPLPEPQNYKHSLTLEESHVSSITASVLKNALDKSMLPLGATIPDGKILPVSRLKNTIARTVKEFPELLCSYTPEKGDHDLRREISVLMLKRGIAVSAEEIVITNGCMEALTIAVQAAADPGDVVAIESPAFFGLIAMLEELKMKVIEIPTSPAEGMDLDILESVLKQKSVNVCIFSACFQNPLGFHMPDENKKRLAELGRKYRVILIEDDIYGECSFGQGHTVPAKSFDCDGNIIYCSSFSKVISPGIRTGWMVPGKYLQACSSIKINRTLGGSMLLQKAFALFLREGGYEYHLRFFRKNIAGQSAVTRELVSRYFPADTKISNPAGGVFLWIELSPDTDSLVLFRKAARAGIGIVPGPVFSPGGNYINCIRISCGTPVGAEIENGIKELGRIAAELKTGS